MQNWRELFTVKKSSPLLYLETLSRWKWKMKIWENCNAKGKMTENKCLSYKICWLVSPIRCWTSPAFRATLLGWWMNGKFSFLNKVAFKVACKGVWCLYNRQNSTWLLVDIGLLLSISHERAHWTRDISSWSLEEKLHRYNITHGVNSSLSILLWQSVTCTSLRRKGIFLIASVLH